MKVTYYVASSLDGYIAKDDGDVSWLDESGITLEESGYEAFFSTVDALVMGRKTYEIIADFGTWPYGDKPTWVCSSSQVTPLEGCNLQAGTTPEEVIKMANKMSVNHLWLVGGGSLASSFIENNLLSNISLSLMPIILGGGIKLFVQLSNPVQIKVESSKSHDAGFMQIEYSINLV